MGRPDELVDADMSYVSVMPDVMTAAAATLFFEVISGQPIDYHYFESFFGF